MTDLAAGRQGAVPITASERRKVVFASSLGTVFEWYDFYLYGALAGIIAAQFFSGVNPTAAFVFALLAFAAGFAVRPFGALFFGRIGDLVGRKYTFLITIVIMGISTFVVGVLPNYASIGMAAPIILIALRLLQGLALGGEYGGAATYVAEHAEDTKRGFLTSFIQTTATLGLFLSMIVILGVRTSIGETAFADWGWRIPFLVSIVLLAISVWIRLQLSESPMFQQMKAEGRGSKAPLTESFGEWRNAKIVLIALFGLTAGQAVVWYTGQFYSLFFLTQTLKVDGATANILVALSLAIATPFFIFFGWLSDKIGRKPIILAGCLLAAATYFPIFGAIAHYANPALEAATRSAPVTVIADPDECSFQFNPVGTSRFVTSCDIVKSFLARASVNYENEAAPPGTIAQVRIGDEVIESFDGVGMPTADFTAQSTAFSNEGFLRLAAAGYPVQRTVTAADGTKTTEVLSTDSVAPGTEVPADSTLAYAPAPASHEQANWVMVTVLLTVLVLYVTMVYGPIAAILVELFPTRIRYTSMSLPYHIGNGWFGGFLPTVSFAIVAATGNIYAGLWYPITIALMTVVVGLIFVRDTRHVDIRR
jgi:MFS family permease